MLAGRKLGANRARSGILVVRRLEMQGGALMAARRPVLVRRACMNQRCELNHEHQGDAERAKSQLRRS